jgi:L-lactate dehydrogenase (cytochrome)
MFLFSLGAGGQQGVERALQNMHDEIRRNMILMGCKSIKDLDNSKIIYKK